jgi:hypothetical protein
MVLGSWVTGYKKISGGWEKICISHHITEHSHICTCYIHTYVAEHNHKVHIED